MVKYINEPCMFVVQITLVVSRIILHSKQYILKLYKEVHYQVHSPTPNILKDTSTRDKLHHRNSLR